MVRVLVTPPAKEPLTLTEAKAHLRLDSTGVGGLDTVGINAGGAGYSVNDVLTVTGGGGASGTLKVLTVNATAVTGVSKLTAGTGYAVTTGALTTVAPAGGTGCTINILTVATADDTYVSSLILAARLRAESFTQRALITQTWDAYWDDFPVGEDIEIPINPLQSVTSLTYTDVDGVTQPLVENTDFVVDSKSVPAWIVLPVGCYWPTPMETPNAVKLEFVAGYGLNETDVPEPIRVALRHWVAHWFENRIPYDQASKVAAVPETGLALLWPYRIFHF